MNSPRETPHLAEIGDVTPDQRHIGFDPLVLDRPVALALMLISALFLAIGTGIGATVVVDGVPVGGAHHRAGEIGHVCSKPGAPSRGR